tara:strand:- start:1019 stop:3937 length:2919 start_codon:yes stop_codon:yes gene_type:complete
MSNVTKFKFVSPGIFINEIDNSQLPSDSNVVGPVVIGRTERGPAMYPTTVQSFEEFVNVFGAPIAIEPGMDVWREGNRQGPTYASYAAQAWLASQQGPVTVVRLLGNESPDATTTGKAGWETSNVAFSTTATSNGGAYGLFLIDSASVASYALTGALAAVWYVDNGYMALSGTIRGPGLVTTASVGTLIQSLGADKEFKAVIYKSDHTTKELETAFNFNRDSAKYIRKVFNTNPQLVNSQVTTSTKPYWLGQTYAAFANDMLNSGSSAGDVFGVILPLKSQDSVVFGGKFRNAYQDAKTGYVISQDLGTDTGAYQPENMQQLFRFCARDSGKSMSRNFKIAIKNVKPSTAPDDINPYGKFDVEIRDARDNDNAIRVLETFTGCDLNPNSLDYVARKIGDKYATWNTTDLRWRYQGTFDNVSRYVRIEMNADVNNGTTNSKYLPMGFKGPLRFKGFQFYSGSTKFGAFGTSIPSVSELNFSFISRPSTLLPAGALQGVGAMNVGMTGSDATDITPANVLDFTGSWAFPKIKMRNSASDGGISDPRNAYFGVQLTRTADSTRFDEDYPDYVYPLPFEIDSYTAGSYTEDQFIFSLDDLIVTGATNMEVFYSSGSRQAGTSYTALNDAKTLLEARGYNKFTMPLFGGFDGLDIKEVEPFRNTKLDGGATTSNYAYYTVKTAIDSIADPEEFEYNVATMPNLQDENLTTLLMQGCEERGDALAIIDLKGDYLLSSENTNDEASRRPNVDTTITNLRSRGLNSSYGCAFFPYVQIRDNINGAILDCPPSVVALGTFGSSQAASQLWFAPAGFNRGGLSTGAGGIPVVGVKQRLNSKDRDKLYTANINPIATFPSEGIVVFGQKTLQITPSALDRINVRRLLIFLKKEISRIAATILFDPNVEVTWGRFRNAAESFLSSVKAGLGLSEYKIVLDSTTTTPDLIDRNALYAKIFLKPARAIEFIAIDFVITRTGAAFED